MGKKKGRRSLMRGLLEFLPHRRPGEHVCLIFETGERSGRPRPKTLAFRMVNEVVYPHERANRLHRGRAGRYNDSRLAASLQVEAPQVGC